MDARQNRRELVVQLFARGASREVLNQSLTEAVDNMDLWKVEIYRRELARREAFVEAVRS